MSLKPALSRSAAPFLTAWKGVGEALRKSTNSFAWLIAEVDIATLYQFLFVFGGLELLATVNIDSTGGRLSMQEQEVKANRTKDECGSSTCYLPHIQIRTTLTCFIDVKVLTSEL